MTGVDRIFCRLCCRPPRVFISYRRSDSNDISHRLADHLRRAFGKGAVFIDVVSIGPGQDFEREIEDFLVSRCDSFLVVIGTDWLHAKDQHGRQRLFLPDDTLRKEIEIALRRTDKMCVYPVLVNGAGMPEKIALPPSIHAISRNIAKHLRSDGSFERDVAELVQVLRRERGTIRWACVVAFVVLLGVVLVLLLMSAIRYDDPTPTPDSTVTIVTEIVTATPTNSPTVGATTTEVPPESPMPRYTLTPSDDPIPLLGDLILSYSQRDYVMIRLDREDEGAFPPLVFEWEGGRLELASLPGFGLVQNNQCIQLYAAARDTNAPECSPFNTVYFSVRQQNVFWTADIEIFSVSVDGRMLGNCTPANGRCEVTIP